MATAEGNILMTIQTKATQGGFADLNGFVQLVAAAAAKIKELSDATFAYTRQAGVLAGSISEADKQTKGLIDTTSLMMHRNKLAAAGINVTADQYAKLTKFAAAQAQVMGEEVEPAVARFMKSLTSGRTTALKQFGIELKESGTVSETFAGVINHVEKNVDGMNVKVRDSKDRMFQLENSIGTAMGEVSKFAGEFTALNAVLDTAVDLLNQFITTLQKLQEIGGSFEGYVHSLVEDIVKPGGLVSNEKLWKELVAQGDKARQQAYNKALKERAEKTDKELTEQFFGPAIPIGDKWTPEGFLKKKKKKGKKGKQETDDQMEFVLDPVTGEAIEKQELESERALMGKGIEDIGALSIEQKMEQIAIDERSLRVVKLDELRTTKDEQWQLELEQADKEKQLQAEKHEWLLLNSEEYAENQKSIDKELFKSRLMGAAETFSDLGSLMDVENKKAFKIGKAAALMSAALGGAVSITQAYARGMEIPFAGWILAPIYAAAAGIKVAADIARISKMEYKGGGETGGSGVIMGALASKFASSSAPALGNGMGAGAGEQRPQIINVTLGADVLMSALINESKNRDRAGYETIELKAGV